MDNPINQSFSDYKNAFLKIASEEYSMEECDFSDDEIKDGISSGHTPLDLMEYFAKKYDLEPVKPLLNPFGTNSNL